MKLVWKSRHTAHALHNQYMITNNKQIIKKFIELPATIDEDVPAIAVTRWPWPALPYMSGRAKRGRVLAALYE